jgi:peptide/nickel transport system substrate-binding protein
MTSLVPTESDSGGDSIVEALVFGRLCRYGSAGEVVADLAKSWDCDVSRCAIIFHLRADAMFHDGAPVTADDVVHSYELYRDASVPAVRKAVVNIASFEALDAHTVRMTVKKGQPLSAIEASFAVMPKHLTQGDGSAYRTSMIGSGSYRYGGIRKDGSTVLRAFDGYFDGAPRLRSIVVKSYQDEDALWTAFVRGETDLQMFMPRVQYERIKDNPAFRAYAFPSEGAYTLLPSPDGAMCDLRMRQALSRAINRQVIIAAVEGGIGREVRAPFSGADKGSLHLHNAAEAAQMLTDAGYFDANGDGLREKDGKPIVVRLGYDEQSKTALAIVKIIRQQWADVGVGLEAVRVPLVSVGDAQWRDAHVDVVLQNVGFLQTLDEVASAFSVNGNPQQMFLRCRALPDVSSQNACAADDWDQEEPAIVLYEAYNFHGVSARVLHNERFFSLYTPFAELKDWDTAE